MIRKYLEEKWEYLRGSQEQFSFENRMVNSICLITFLMVFMLLVFNVSLSLFEEALISVSVIIVNAYVYYLARSRKKYRTSIAIYIIGSYIALFFVYYYNSGISGPTLFSSFLHSRSLPPLHLRSITYSGPYCTCSTQARFAL